MKIKRAALLAVAVSASLAGCVREGKPAEVSGAVSDFEVVFLFERDGCKVYRFYDSRHHYFTTCGEAIGTHSKSCGKGCTKRYDENIR